MSEFYRVASVEEMPDPSMKLCEVDEYFVILFHVNGQFSCIDDVCTHDGGTLSDGELDSSKGCIECPRHGAHFDIVSGKAVTMPATQDTFAHEVKIEGNEIFVKLSPELE